MPVWLPESVNHARETDSLRIKYVLRCGYLPLEYTTCEQEIHVLNPVRVLSKQNLEYTLRSEVGGMLGFGSSQSQTKVTFARNVYEPGDTIKLRIDCDNSQCSAKVKSFKIKLQRKWVGFAQDSQYKSSEYLKIVKLPGVESYKQKSETVDFELPQFNQFYDSKQPYSKHLSSSVTGSLLSIQYYIRFFIKHSSMTEFGEGHCITLPVWIQQPYMSIQTQTTETQKGKVMPAADLALPEID